jgi:hypothetical protein
MRILKYIVEIEDVKNEDFNITTGELEEITQIIQSTLKSFGYTSGCYFIETIITKEVEDE